MNVTLSPEVEDLIRQKVESGLYSDASEVVHDALRQMDERDRQLAWLREEVAKGVADIERGDTIPYTPELREEMIQNAIRRAKAGEKPSTDVVP
jgi:antitoxin ParD1/3/4